MTPRYKITPEICWAGGLFEGEGCIGIKDEPSNLIRLTLVSTDKDIVDRFYSIVGVGTKTFRKSKKENWKDSWQWCVVGRAAEDLLPVLAPFFGERRRARAVEVLEARLRFVEERTKSGNCSECGEAFVPKDNRGTKQMCGSRRCYNRKYKRLGQHE